MADDIAMLGLAVDFSKVVAADQALDKFAASAKAAEVAAKGFEQGAQRSNTATAQLMQNLTKTANSAQALNARLNVKDSFGSAERAADIMHYGQALDDTRAKLVPLHAVQRQYASQLAEINTAAKVGAISEQERATAAQKAEVAFRMQSHAIDQSNKMIMAAGKGATLNAQAMANLSFQLNDVATMAALGMDPLRIVATQAGQFYQILAQGEQGVRGSLRFLFDTFTSLLTPIRLLVAGVSSLAIAAVTAGNSWANAQNEIRLALLGVGGAAGVTAGDINRILFAAVEAGTATVWQARAMALAFASTGKIATDVAERAVMMSRNLGKIFGEEPEEAARRLARSLADPVRNLDDINKRLGTFDDSTVQHIKNLAAQNRLYEAQKLQLDGVKRSTDAAAGATSIWESNWQKLARTASEFWSKFGREAANAVGAGPMEDQLGMAQRRLAELILQRNRLLERDQAAGNTRRNPAMDARIDEQVQEVNRLKEAMAGVAREAERVANNMKSIDLGGMVRSAVPEVAEFQRKLNDLARIRDFARRPEVIGGLSKELQRELDTAQRVYELRVSGHRTTLHAAFEEHRLQMQSITARTAAQKGELAFRETLARLQPSGDPQADLKADLARTRAIAEHNHQISESMKAQVLSGQQRTQLSALELSLVGQTAAVQERARAVLEVRQQVEAEALRLYGSRDAYDQKHLDALTQEALKNADINRALKERQLMLDIQFEREQLGRTSREQSVYARLQSSGMLVNGEIQGSAAEAAAAQIRLNNILQTNMDMSREFTSSLVRDLMAGRDATEALSNALLRLADRFADLAMDHAFQAIFGGKSGANSWISSLLGMGGGGSGGMGSWTTTTVPEFHRGGIVGANDNGMTRTVHPGVFAGARRYHGGGIAGLRADEVPAILQRGERVIARGESSGGMSFQINIPIDASGADTAAIQRLDEAVFDMKRQLPSIIVRTVQQAKDRRVA